MGLPEEELEDSGNREFRNCPKTGEKAEWRLWKCRNVDRWMPAQMLVELQDLIHFHFWVLGVGGV